MKKESIKEILNAGGSIKVPYKQSIDSWWGELSISKLDKSEYVIQPHWQKFSDIDEAVNWFLNEGFTSKNKGYIQKRLSEKGVNFETGYDLEHPNPKLKKLFKDEGKLVDQEASLLNISVKKFPEVKEAIEEADLIKNTTVDTLCEFLHNFEQKYMSLDPYINLGFIYETSNGGEPYDFTSSMDYTNFNEKIFNEYNQSKKNLKYKHVGVTIKLKGSDYIRYELNF